MYYYASDDDDNFMSASKIKTCSFGGAGLGFRHRGRMSPERAQIYADHRKKAQQEDFNKNFDKEECKLVFVPPTDTKPYVSAVLRRRKSSVKKTTKKAASPRASPAKRKSSSSPRASPAKRKSPSPRASPAKRKSPSSPRASPASKKQKTSVKKLPRWQQQLQWGAQT